MKKILNLVFLGLIFSFYLMDDSQAITKCDKRWQKANDWAAANNGVCYGNCLFGINCYYKSDLQKTASTSGQGVTVKGVTDIKGDGDKTNRLVGNRPLIRLKSSKENVDLGGGHAERVNCDAGAQAEADATCKKDYGASSGPAYGCRCGWFRCVFQCLPAAQAKTRTMAPSNGTSRLKPNTKDEAIKTDELGNTYQVR